jgi:hypothetical protein
MQAQSSHRSSSSSNASSYRLAAALYRVVESAMSTEFEEQYDAHLLFHRLVLEEEQGALNKSTMRLRIDCRGLTEMPAQITVTETGDTAYDVLCTVQNGSSHRFSYCLPSEATSSVSCAPYLGRDLASFLRTELENRLGRLLLRSAARPPTNRASLL